MEEHSEATRHTARTGWVRWQHGHMFCEGALGRGVTQTVNITTTTQTIPECLAPTSQSTNLNGRIISGKREEILRLTIMSMLDQYRNGNGERDRQCVREKERVRTDTSNENIIDKRRRRLKFLPLWSDDQALAVKPSVYQSRRFLSATPSPRTFICPSPPL